MAALTLDLDAIAVETSFSGVVRVDRADRVEIAKAYGFAHRGYEIANEVDTRFATASGTKGLTALTVVSLSKKACSSFRRPLARCSGRSASSATT
jgi:CubicO group peptidase (beta-lactamase class C family)